MQVTEIALLNSTVTVYSTATQNFKRKDRGVVSTPNGLEIGLVKGQVEAKNVEEFVDIIRHATVEDSRKNCENCRYTRTLVGEIKNEVERLNLDMKVSAFHTNLDRYKLEIDYTADNIVDFRELIKILSSRFKMKI